MAELATCEHPDGCTRPRKARGLCLTHYQRWRMTGNAGVAEIAESDFWCDRDNGYQTAHTRVTQRRGRAAELVCTCCGEDAKQWAYDHLDPDERQAPNGSRYSNDPEHYLPMCIPCHRRFDHEWRAGLADDAKA